MKGPQVGVVLLALGACNRSTMGPQPAPDAAQSAGIVAAMPQHLPRRGKGEPKVLATGQKGLGSIAVDSTNVYWATEPASEDTKSKGDDGRIMKVAADGGAPVQLTTKHGIQAGIAVHGAHVLWPDSGMMAQDPTSIMAIPVSGGRASKLATGKTATFGALAVTDDGVFWSTDNGILKTKETGPSAAQIVTTPDEPKAFAVRSGLVVFESRGNLMKVSAAGGNAEVLVAVGRIGKLWSIALDDSNVYWTDDGDEPDAGRVLKASLRDGAPSVLAANQYKPRHIVSDATHVYWVTNHESRGTLVNMHKDGEAAAVLAGSLHSPWDIALAAGAVFWTNAGDGSVMRLDLEPAR